MCAMLCRGAPEAQQTINNLDRLLTVGKSGSLCRANCANSVLTAVTEIRMLTVSNPKLGISLISQLMMKIGCFFHSCFRYFCLTVE